MSDDTQRVEQITKEPSDVPKREKDPKRVAAGKKLAEKNKQMREEHARYKASEEERQASVPETETGGSDLLSQLSLTNVISLVGIGLTAYTIFFSNRGEKRVAWQEPVHTTMKREESKTEEPKPKSKSTKKTWGM